MEMKATKKLTVDPVINNTKFENVPQQLIHYLMNFLPCKDATKLGVLSKDFYSHWLTFPVLEFNYDFFQRMNNPHETFFSHVRRITELRAPHVARSLHKLIFSYHEEVNSAKLYDYRAAFDALLNFAAENSCKVLIFDVEITIPYRILMLDRKIATNKIVSFEKLLPFFASRFLTVLKLTGLKFSPDADASITCKNLAELLIRSCEGFKTINVSSPSLKKVEVRCCNGLGAFQVMGGEGLESFIFEGIRNYNGVLQPCDVDIPVRDSLKYMHLAKVKVLAEKINEVVTEFLNLGRCDLPRNLHIFNPHIKVLEMDTNTGVQNLVLHNPDLETFKFKGLEGEACSLNISECLALKILKLMDVTTLTDAWFENVMLHLVCLKEVDLINCAVLRRMKFETHILEKLTLYGCLDLKEVMITCPNLVEFNYIGKFDVSPLLVLSSKCSGSLRLVRNTSDDLLWFETMIGFLRHFDHFKHLTFSCDTAKDMIFPWEFVWPNKLPPLHDVKDIKFETRGMPKDETLAKLVDCVLWVVPKPHSLALSSLDTGKTRTLKFGHGKRVEARKVEECCSMMPFKCWKHFVLKVEYEGFDDGEEGEAMKQCLQKFFAPYMRELGPIY